MATTFGRRRQTGAPANPAQRTSIPSRYSLWNGFCGLLRVWRRSLLLSLVHIILLCSSCRQQQSGKAVSHKKRTRPDKKVGRPRESFSPSATPPARCSRPAGGAGAGGATPPAEGATLPLRRPECEPPPPPPLSTPSPFPRRPRSTPGPTYFVCVGCAGVRGGVDACAVRGKQKARTKTWRSYK